MRDISKECSGVKALQNISFDIRSGEVHILMGENGAGKSTLMKILSGVYQPISGTITVKGKEYFYLTPKDSYDGGISIIYKELSVIKELSIVENLFVGKLPTKKMVGVSVVDYKTMLEYATTMLKKVGLEKNTKQFVEELSISEKQQCEIAKALVSKADVIVMDEPTTSLTTTEVEHLFTLIRQLKAEGKGIVYISHKMDEIKQIGDRITVLKDGTYIGTRNVSEVTIDEIIKMMVGREVSGNYHNSTGENLQEEPILFEVKHIISKNKKVKDVSFQLHKGEILGFAGLVGSGRSELMNTIFEAEEKQSGEVFVGGEKVFIDTPYDAIKNGLAMVTENRRETGFLSNFSIKENISIVSFLKSSKRKGLFGLVDKGKEVEYAKREKQNMNIKCRSIEQNITELLGGNQQKVILGK